MAEGSNAGRQDVTHRHVQEFFPGISIVADGGIVDLDEAESLQVTDPHRQWIAFKKEPVAFLRGAQLSLGQLLRCHIPGNTFHSDHRSCIVVRSHVLRRNPHW